MDTLTKFIEKLSHYEILNFLIPGSILCVLLKYLVGIDLLDFSFLEVLVICYFIGMVNSRLGSIFLYPLLKACKILKEAPYPDFIEAEKLDGKVAILSEINNMYRSMCNAMLLLLLAYLAVNIDFIVAFLKDNMNWISIISLLVIFVLSYAKQTNFVRNRVEASLHKKNIKE